MVRNTQKPTTKSILRRNLNVAQAFCMEIALIFFPLLRMKQTNKHTNKNPNLLEITEEF